MSAVQEHQLASLVQHAEIEHVEVERRVVADHDFVVGDDRRDLSAGPRSIDGQAERRAVGNLDVVCRPDVAVEFDVQGATVEQDVLNVDLTARNDIQGSGSDDHVCRIGSVACQVDRSGNADAAAAGFEHVAAPAHVVGEPARGTGTDVQFQDAVAVNQDRSRSEREDVPNAERSALDARARIGRAGSVGIRSREIQGSVPLFDKGSRAGDFPGIVHFIHQAARSDVHGQGVVRVVAEADFGRRIPLERTKFLVRVLQIQDRVALEPDDRGVN